MQKIMKSVTLWMEIRGMKIRKQTPMMRICLAMLLLGEKAGKCLVSVSVFSNFLRSVDNEHSRRL